MALITGNTFPVKDQLKSLGGRWDANAKGWVVPDSVADQARALVKPNPTTTTSCRSGNTCAECGRGGALVRDLEDGLYKHYRCCDIPPGGY